MMAHSPALLGKGIASAAQVPKGPFLYQTPIGSGGDWTKGDLGLPIPLLGPVLCMAQLCI